MNETAEMDMDLELREGPADAPVRAHGARIPVIGLGTWELSGEDARRIVREALEMGYRHIDTAQAYRNEREVGDGVRAAGLPRDEVWITTKVWPDNYSRGRFRASVDASLESLGVESVDLLLLHWPLFEGTDLESTIERLNEIRVSGRTRHIGVSNFTVEQLDRAWAVTEAPLVVNQVEYHAFLDQGPILQAARRHGMVVTAYSPLARGRVAGDETLRKIGRTHGKTAAQVALHWLVQQDGVVAIPRTSTEAHCRENLDIFDFALSEEEMREIATLARPDGRLVAPDSLAPSWD